MQFIPLNYLYSIPLNNPKSVEFNETQPRSNDTQFTPPDDKEVDFSNTPSIHFSIKYKVDEVLMEIKIKNNSTSSLTLFNLWFQVNKSSPIESIILENTKIIETQNKLSLSTFDIDKSDEFYENGSMIFHLKLFEGEIISVNEEFNIKLNWHDPDKILAQYDPNLIYNRRSDDIEVFFQYSTRVEENQPFPVIERSFNRKWSSVYEGLKEYILNFRVANLMDSNLEIFNFSYVKMKDFSYEKYIDFVITSPDLTASEILDVELIYDDSTDKIEFNLSFGDSVVLELNEWLNIEIVWVGHRRESSIRDDYTTWIFGESDEFNKGLPYYLVGFPFHPLLTPAEPITTLDYDKDGLKNYLEIANGYDPSSENMWLSWNSLISDYFLNSQASKNLEIRGEVVIMIPSSFYGKELSMKILNLGSDNTITNLKFNDILLNDDIINSPGDYVIDEVTDMGLHTIRFDLNHGDSAENSFYEIKFFLDNNEIPDKSVLFQPDSDGDGVFDILEEEDNLLVPDADNDGAFDGIDIMPNRYLSYSSGTLFELNFPIKDINSNSDISVNIQIKPTENDYTDNIPYAGNELMIVPGMKIYGISSIEGGDYLPDNSFTLDNGKTGIVHLIPLRHGDGGDCYSWGGNINYKYDNLAKQGREISFKFTLVWLIFEHDSITGKSNLYHIYENNDPYIVQGISITENEPTSVVIGVAGDGASAREAVTYAEFLAHIYTSQISYDPSDVSDLNHLNDTVFDIQKLNESRDNLRDQLIDSYQLNYDTTYFIYITYGYSLGYNLDGLFDAFPGEEFLRDYTDQEIDDFYLLPNNTFIGMAVIQFIKQAYLEYVDQFVYGIKTDIETKTHDLQAVKFIYVGYSCEMIFQFIGTEDTDLIEIWYYDFNSRSNNIIMSDTGGYFKFIAELNVFRFQISKPEYTPPGGSIWGDFILWNFYVSFYAPIESKIIRKASVWIALRIVSLYIGGLGGKFLRILIKYTYINKITGGLDVLFGVIRLIHGIGAYFQGAYNTGLKEGVRGYLMVVNGLLWIAAEPTGVTKILAIILTVFLIIDGVLQFFGFDFWGWWFSTFFGIEDANPDHQITSNSVIYNTEKIQSQGGFEVGDSIGVRIGLRNIGNTELTFGLKVQAGGGSYGTRSTTKINRGNSGSISASDTLEQASPTFTLTSQVDMSFYYDPPGRWGPVPWFPFFWYFDPDPVTGGPEYGAPNVGSFDIPVFPNTLASFVYLVKSGAWFPTDLPEAEVNIVQNEITPGVSETLDYDLTIFGTSKTRTYVIETPIDGLWDYSVTYQGNVQNYISIPAGSSRTLHITITPTQTNVLNPGEDSIFIRITQEDLTLARINAFLPYKVLEIVDFNVIFDPGKPEGEELNFDAILLYYINISNTGNIVDSYDIEVDGLENNLYSLFVPYYNATVSRISVRPHAMYSALIVFQIPYFAITLPGMREFEINVTSVTDPTVKKTFDCSIEINEYHRIYFDFVEEEEANQSMTDSDTYTYNLNLINLGNVDENVTISWTDIDIATVYIENDFFSMISDQTEYFYIELTPFELGYQEFNITASSPWISETIEASINIIDDDTQYPYFEYFSIEDNHNWLNLSFIAKDDLLGDDQGLSNIDVYVDDVLVYNYVPISPTQTIFNFSIPNDWIWLTGDWIDGKRTYKVTVNITDADDDRISDDSLTTSISGTFDVTLDEMYQYVMWLCEDMNNYIYDNSITALYGVVSQKIVKIQVLLWDAYQLIEDGYLHTGLVRNKMAEIKLEIAETKTELMINKQSMTQEHFDHLKDSIRNIRNKIVELMGLSMGTPFSHAISLAEVDIYNLRDFVEDNINAADSENLANSITLAAEKLENALFDISLDKDTESSITSAQNALDRARAEVIALVSKGKISQDLGATLEIEILVIKMKIEDLKNTV